MAIVVRAEVKKILHVITINSKCRFFQLTIRGLNVLLKGANVPNTGLETPCKESKTPLIEGQHYAL
jgi:hypothetical protein